VQCGESLALLINPKLGTVVSSGIDEMQSIIDGFKAVEAVEGYDVPAGGREGGREATGGDER